MKDIGIALEDLAGAVGVVGVRVHDRETPEAEFLPQVDDAESHIVEAAEAPEFVAPRMVPARPDEREGVRDLPVRNLLSGGDDTPRRVPGGGAKGVFSHTLQKIRRVDLQQQLPGDGLRLVQLDLVALQNLVQGAREVGQPGSDGQVAPPGEGRVIEDAGNYSHFGGRFSRKARSPSAKSGVPSEVSRRLELEGEGVVIGQIEAQRDAAADGGERGRRFFGQSRGVRLDLLPELLREARRSPRAPSRALPRP